jgi:hypothetical protein
MGINIIESRYSTILYSIHCISANLKAMGLFSDGAVTNSKVLYTSEFHVIHRNGLKWRCSIIGEEAPALGRQLIYCTHHSIKTSPRCSKVRSM